MKSFAAADPSDPYVVYIMQPTTETPTNHQEPSEQN